jgi:hypothetical protein
VQQCRFHWSQAYQPFPTKSTHFPEEPEKANAGGSAPDMPTSARCRMARKHVEPPQIGKSK